jgi:hypothetical protein
MWLSLVTTPSLRLNGADNSRASPADRGEYANFGGTKPFLSMATIHFIEPRVVDRSTTPPTDRGEHNILGRIWMQLSLAIMLLFNRVTMRAA